MIEIEPVAESAAAPFADAMGADRRRGALLAKGINPSDIIGYAGRRIAQDEARDAFGMGGREQETDDPAGGFADPMHLLQRHGIEHCEELVGDLFRRYMVSGCRGI